MLRNNYLQTLAISVAALRRFEDFPFQVRLMQNLEAQGLLNRKVESLPDDTTLAERQTRDQPLTRPEIGVLLAYAKITLFDELLTRTLPDDKAMRPELFGYFPDEMRAPWKREIEGHRLRREIIATALANAMINRGGPTFLARIADRTGADADGIARAFCVVRDAFGIEEICAAIDRLDARIAGTVQLKLYLDVQELILSRTIWFLRNARLTDDLPALDRHLRKGGCRRRQEPGVEPSRSGLRRHRGRDAGPYLVGRAGRARRPPRRGSRPWRRRPTSI